MKQFILSLSICFYAVALLAQDFEVPAVYRFETKADYASQEAQVLKAAYWLYEHPLDKEQAKRTAVTAFIMDWSNGSPVLHNEISPAILELEQRNPGMLGLYVAGCIRYVLENRYSTDMRAKHKAALLLMMDYYKNAGGVKRDKNMRAIIHANKEGQLDQWINEHIPVLS